MIRIFRLSIRQYDIRYSRFAFLFILLSVIAAVSNVISIQATGNMTQAAQFGVTDEITGFLVLLAVSGVVQALAAGFSALIEKRFYGRVIHSIRFVFADRLLRSRYKDFASRNSGEGASLFTVDVPQAASFLSIQILSQVAQITTLLVSVAFMAYINWWLTLIYFALIPVLALLQAKLATPIGRKSEEAAKRRAEYNAVVADALQNPLTVLAYGLEASVEKRFSDSFAKFYKARYAASRTTAGLALFGIFATFLPVFALFFVSCALVIADRMTIAGFISLAIVAGPVGNWLTMFAQELARLQTAAASAVRLGDFLPKRMETDGSFTIIEPSDIYAATFRNVSFGYGDDGGVGERGDGIDGGGESARNGDSKVFNAASFSIEKGLITAIAGPSGCGKSTALKLMLGLYKPDSGVVSLSSENITYVPQDCYLLPVSIRENILGGLPLDEKRLQTACQNAGIIEFINSLPDGFDSILAESAANVSGGQKQRLAMARAFYRDADILLLDEATSALDPVTESAVLESFRRYIKENGKTAVVVAHRKSVLEMSDRIITLGNGGRSHD